jgi:uncharacterized membrane protein YdjX (TVP38/TMEM64 family)
MDTMIFLAFVFAIVFAVNLMPVFGPPTWAVLVVCDLRWNVGFVPLVVAGAAAATLGRVCLALGCRRLGTHLPDKRQGRLAAAGDLLSTRAGLVGSLFLFVISPVPSAQLWEAAGLARVRLAPLAAAFLAGRIVSYALYVQLGRLTEESLRDVLADGLVSTKALAIQVISFAILVAFVLIDWTRLATWISSRSGPGRARSGRARHDSRGRASA